MLHRYRIWGPTPGIARTAFLSLRIFRRSVPLFYLNFSEGLDFFRHFDYAKSRRELPRNAVFFLREPEQDGLADCVPFHEIPPHVVDSLSGKEKRNLLSVFMK